MVISALGYSLNHDAIEVEDAGDVTAVVSDLIGQAVNALDVVELTRAD